MIDGPLRAGHCSVFSLAVQQCQKTAKTKAKEDQQDQLQAEAVEEANPLDAEAQLQAMEEVSLDRWLLDRW
jgi:hypothetical protein